MFSIQFFYRDIVLARIFYFFKVETIYYGIDSKVYRFRILVNDSRLLQNRHLDYHFFAVIVTSTLEPYELVIEIKLARAKFNVVVVFIRLLPDDFVTHLEVFIRNFLSYRFPFVLVPKVYTLKSYGVTLRYKLAVFGILYFVTALLAS